MKDRTIKLSTADIRREAVIASAIAAFSQSGYLGTPISSVAEHAGISTAYVFKLFPGKTSLFVAALDRCYELIEEILESGANSTTNSDPDTILYAMGGAYAELIADRDLLMLQVHAQSASDVPEIGDALRRGLRRVTLFAKERSGAPNDAVQRFMAFGQLCHLLTTAGLHEQNDEWSEILTEGIRHHPSKERI